MKFKNWLKS